MSSDKQTTPTINGLRLVTPEEAGYRDISKHGNKVEAVLFRGSRFIGYVLYGDNCTNYEIYNLIPLTKPRTTRPFRRGEVRLGDGFRGPAGSDFAVTRIAEDGVFFGTGFVSWETLLANYHKLTYDSEGREVLEVAGVEE